MKFLSPKGAVKDAKELEYLVALHQTTHEKIEEFRDGSIDGTHLPFLAFFKIKYYDNVDRVIHCRFRQTRMCESS